MLDVMSERSQTETKTVTLGTVYASLYVTVLLYVTCCLERMRLFELNGEA